MTTNILEFTGDLGEKSGFQKNYTHGYNKQNNVISLAEEKSWRELESKMIEEERNSIFTSISQTLAAQKTHNPEKQSATIIPFKRSA